jgi:hypothetical protein
MLVSLCSKHALRGGIDVGLATEIAEGEIYGTALEHAYLLESKRAKYPRIVIGEQLWGYLSAAIAEFEKRGTPDGKALKAIVQKMMQFISIDTNGERILDYLGSGIAELMKPGRRKQWFSRLTISSLLNSSDCSLLAMRHSASGMGFCADTLSPACQIMN